MFRGRAMVFPQESPKNAALYVPSRGAWWVSGDPVPWLCGEWCWDRATWVYVGLRGRYITVQSACKHPGG